MRFFKLIPVVITLVFIAACSTGTPTTVAQPTQAVPTQASDTPTSAPTATNVPPTQAPPTSAPTQPQPSATTAPTQAAPTEQAPTETTAPANTPAASNSGSFTLDLEPVVDELRRPVVVTHAGDGSNRLFIVEQPGRILIYENGQQLSRPFLDLRDKVTTSGNEQGLLGLAFHPDFETNGLFFVNYSRKEDGDNVIERFQVTDNPNVVNSNSGTVILTIEGAEPNHNGGDIAFGPDGFLYIGTGDGGGAGDRHGTPGNGQSLNTLLGKMLRIDVNADTYTVPGDNPFGLQAGAAPEIWAYGLRNPWRISFDRETGDLYIADVGQANKEEINFQPASSRGGENYGWRILEGDECYDESLNCEQEGLVAPIVVYGHEFGCAVTGGYVYRGQQYPWLAGQYIFADYCTGIVWATARDASGAWNTRRVTTFDDTISSFGEDEAGELYVIGHNSGTVYKLTSAQ